MGITHLFFLQNEGDYQINCGLTHTLSMDAALSIQPGCCSGDLPIILGVKGLLKEMKQKG